MQKVSIIIDGFVSCRPSLVWEYRPIRNATLRRVVIRRRRRIRFDGCRIYEFARVVWSCELFRYGSEGWPVRPVSFLVSIPTFESHLSTTHHGSHRRKGGYLDSREVEWGFRWWRWVPGIQPLWYYYQASTTSKFISIICRLFNFLALTLLLYTLLIESFLLHSAYSSTLPDILQVCSHAGSFG